MPVYSYLCRKCYVMSEATRPAARRDADFKCPICKSSSDTQRTVSSSNVHTPMDGHFRGTGKADLDKLIGADAEEKHEYYAVEKEKKNKVRLEHKTNAIGRTSSGDYVPVPTDRLSDRQAGLETFNFVKTHGEKISG